MHIVLQMCPHVQIAWFFKLTSCDNQALVGCILIATVAVHLNLKSYKLVSHLIRCITITYWIFKSLRKFEMPVQKKSQETYWMHQVSSSCHAISMDIADPLSPPLLIDHYFRHVLSDTSRIGIELLYVVSSWSSCLCTTMRRCSLEYLTYELVPISPAVSCMSGSSNFDSFRDGWVGASNTEQTLETAHHKAAAVRPPTTHHENHQYIYIYIYKGYISR